MQGERCLTLQKSPPNVIKRNANIATTTPRQCARPSEPPASPRSSFKPIKRASDGEQRKRKIGIAIVSIFALVGSFQLELCVLWVAFCVLP